ncbi:uncharacterized protein [Agelaius tricolor]|uniref:uncharacterized protein n=1 Tax=Agelaius tricolor TaxID=9191 RepID=UPI0039F1D96E
MPPGRVEPPLGAPSRTCVAPRGSPRLLPTLTASASAARHPAPALPRTLELPGCPGTLLLPSPVPWSSPAAQGPRSRPPPYPGAPRLPRDPAPALPRTLELPGCPGTPLPPSPVLWSSPATRHPAPALPRTLELPGRPGTLLLPFPVPWSSPATRHPAPSLPRTLELPGCPGTPLPRPPPRAVLCLRQLGTAEAPSPARPSFVDNKLGFHREAQSPPPPSRSPSPGLPSGWSRALSASPSPLRIAAEGPLFLRPVPLIAITSPFLESALSFLLAIFFLPSLKHSFPVPFCQHDNRSRKESR